MPFKEKDAIQAAYKEAMASKFPGFGSRGPRRNERGTGRGERRPMTEIDRLKEQFNSL